MTDKPVLEPSVEHPITLTGHGAAVSVAAGGRELGRSTAVLDLAEADYPIVCYVPRADVDLTLLRRSEHTTYCPYKGDAAYYDVVVGDTVLENAVWTYEQAFPAVAAIEGHLAFYVDRVSVTDVD